MRRSAWLLVALPWVLAAATLAWAALPRTDDAAQTDGGAGRAQQRLASLEDSIAAATARADMLREELETVARERGEIDALVLRYRRRIAALQEQVEALREQAAAEAAQEAAEDDYPTTGRRPSPSPTPADGGCEGMEGGECPPA